MGLIRSLLDAVLMPFRMLARIPSNVISSPRRMLGLSLPARTAWLLFLGLLAIALVWGIVRSGLDDREQFSQFLRRELPAIAVLIVATPTVVYFALRMWLEGEKSPYPGIDRAGQSGLESLRGQAIDPAETPIFLILGPPDVETVSAFTSASNLAFPVRVPVGPGPLHWFANRGGIYIVCTECCRLGQVLGGSGVPIPEGPAGVATAGGAGGPAFDPTRTMQVGFGSEPPLVDESRGADAPPGGGPGGGADAGDIRRDLADVRVPMPQSPGGDLRGTMMIGDAGIASDRPLHAGPVAAVTSDPRAAEEATARLTHLCRLLRRLRDPLCPINGVLTVTPFGLLADGGQPEFRAALAGLKSDLACIRGNLRVRCGVTHLVSGMEKEAGFRELIRRVGPERAATQRFGKGFGLWNIPDPSQLEAVAKHACGAFEDWSYLLFREGEGLSRPGNRHLYALLCRIRAHFQTRLTHLLQAAYGRDPASASVTDQEPLLFSGCYFVADGPTPDRQGFLASVFGKMTREEEELEWGSEAVAEERRMQALVQSLLVINGVLVAAIVGMLIYGWLER